MPSVAGGWVTSLNGGRLARGWRRALTAALLVSALTLAPGAPPGGSGRPSALAAPAWSPPTAPVTGPAAAPDNSILLQPFVSGLSAPVFMTHANDGTGRLFVVEQGGRIRIVQNGQVRQTPFLDLSASISAGGEQGLLGLAFHPQYQQNGRFFVFLTAKPPPGTGNNVLAEFRVSSDPNIASPAPVRTLFSLVDEYGNHNGGMIGFGPDGFLYVGMGDEGSGGDPKENAQNLNVLYGKLLRLDVDNGGNPFPPEFTYAIPPGNPFAQGGGRPEIWAYGFRNPWRWSFDRQTGDIFVGDVGQGAWEEVSFIPAGQSGGNYGWDDREGAHCHEPASGCQTANRIDPILEYSRSSNGGPCASITGGYRYRGPTQAALQGIYFYADYCTGRIWKGVQAGNSWTAVEALDTEHRITSFAEDQAGEVYVVTSGGAIFQLKQMAAPDCSARPPVTVQSVRSGPGTLTVTLRANDSATVAGNEIRSVAVTQIVNAFVTLGSQVNRQTAFTVAFPGGVPSTELTVRRQQAGQAFWANLTVTDVCGEWRTFVGGGTGLL